ncbi:protein shisa-like-1 [Latimeria chalumnae]|uniref:Shisa N-terminal domain-containing protein n=1 Tax=Latimeria chalumnae TaxID=7897 RepID=M3XJ96_LATCH|nr:PREDICTED: uncharacterized protein KIAA1644-like [Latimeria chalumnae]XP_014340381.1 PREDICTED: uncharacterized protein KIAA1644-like [Latimeria chalumnae]XP_014340382.1 PREDICTED: uncharacterized protein KIAA1644-like [Latimeria chalumnae]|eukprot:XP_014340380.1 PREDICTED: uncharacterized protein KIAA1644-like [Latimeria chalumnae]
MELTNQMSLIIFAPLLSQLLLSAFAFNFKICEGYMDANELYHYGFSCPRLSETHDHAYCCYRGNHTFKYCCNQSEFESVMKVNPSAISTQYMPRNPLPLLGVGLYSCFVFALMIVDFLYLRKRHGGNLHTLCCQSILASSLVSSILGRNK